MDYNQMREDDCTLMISGVTQQNNKKKRIASLEPLIINRQLLLNECLTLRLISQLQLFPTAEGNGQDALHGAMEFFKKPVSAITTLLTVY